MNNQSRQQARIAYHIANLDQVETATACRAERWLVHYGPWSVEPLIAACKHTNPTVRYRAAWALGLIGDSRAFEVLLLMTHDPAEEVAYDACIALGKLRDPRGIEALSQLALEDPYRPEALAGLDEYGLDQLPALRVLLDRGNADVRWGVTQSLGRMIQRTGSPEAREILEECLADRDPHVNENATCWLSDAQL